MSNNVLEILALDYLESIGSRVPTEDIQFIEPIDPLERFVESIDPE